jgi:hypothetical protein
VNIGVSTKTTFYCTPVAYSTSMTYYWQPRLNTYFIQLTSAGTAKYGSTGLCISRATWLPGKRFPLAG